MLRLSANKTSLYKLVSDYEGGLPPMRRTTFGTACRRSNYWLKWYDAVSGLWCKTFFSVCGGHALLAVTRKGFCGPERSRVVHGLTLGDLQGRGMVEEFIPAEERRRMERRTSPWAAG